MFRLFVVTVLVSLFLSACSPTGQVTPQSVVDWIGANCGVAVQLADIAALVTANPAVASAAAIGKEVCDAINSQKSAKAAAPPASGVVVVNGVPVHWTAK